MINKQNPDFKNNKMIKIQESELIKENKKGDYSWNEIAVDWRTGSTIWSLRLVCRHESQVKIFNFHRNTTTHENLSRRQSMYPYMYVYIYIYYLSLLSLSLSI